MPSTTSTYHVTTTVRARPCPSGAAERMIERRAAVGSPVDPDDDAGGVRAGSAYTRTGNRRGDQARERSSLTTERRPPPCAPTRRRRPAARGRRSSWPPVPARSWEVTPTPVARATPTASASWASPVSSTARMRSNGIGVSIDHPSAVDLDDADQVARFGVGPRPRRAVHDHAVVLVRNCGTPATTDPGGAGPFRARPSSSRLLSPAAGAVVGRPGLQRMPPAPAVARRPAASARRRGRPRR